MPSSPGHRNEIGRSKTIVRSFFLMANFQKYTFLNIPWQTLKLPFENYGLFVFQILHGHETRFKTKRLPNEQKFKKSVELELHKCEDDHFFYGQSLPQVFQYRIHRVAFKNVFPVALIIQQYVIIVPLI